MVETSEYREIVEERYKLVVFLKLISKKYDYMGVFAQPSFVKKHLGCFLRTTLHTEVASLEGHTKRVRCLAFHQNKLFSGSDDNTIINGIYTHECRLLKNTLKRTDIPSFSGIPSP